MEHKIEYEEKQMLYTTIRIAKPQLLDFQIDPWHKEAVINMAKISHSKSLKPSITTWPKDKEKAIRLLHNLYEWGHHSVFEHTFVRFIVFCSRACSHQLVRHRLASYTQRSQRYITEDPIFIVPPSLEHDFEYLETLIKAQRSYFRLLHHAKPEDARYVLPNATGTIIGVTMNFRELMQASWERLCMEAQWEIRLVFNMVRAQVCLKSNDMCSFLTPKCGWLGRCPMNKTDCPFYKLYVERGENDGV